MIAPFDRTRAPAEERIDAARPITLPLSPARSVAPTLHPFTEESATRRGKFVKPTASMAEAVAARRCGAKTRAGTPCRQAAVTGNRRCRMHGGARGTGRPPSHGWYTRKAIADRRKLREILDGAPLTTFTAALRRLARDTVPAFVLARLKKPHTKGPLSAFGFLIRTP